MGSATYQILEIAGSGTYGTVVKARDLAQPDGPVVGLKVLRADHVDDDRILARARDEARILALLSHPVIVRVHAIENILGRPVVVMEWVDGLSLGDLIDEGGRGLPPADAIEMVRQASLALDYAWTHTPSGGRAMRIVHRDVKPSNMLLSAVGEVKLVDFGTAKADFEGKESVTRSMVLGTRAYLSPERLDGAEDTPAGDVFAMGLVLYELYMGRHMQLSMNERKHSAVLADRLRGMQPQGLSEPAFAELLQLLRTMCEYEVADRPSHGQVAAELARLAELGALRPDLPGLAQRTVVPSQQARRTVRPRHHPDWAEVRFLEADAARARLAATPTPTPTPAPAPPPAAPPDAVPPTPSAETRAVDDQIRAMLADANWERNLPALQRLLGRSPHWSEAPLHEVLDQALAPRWKVWGTRPPPRKIAVALELLKKRATLESQLRARALATHSDRLVAFTARALLATAEDRA